MEKLLTEAKRKHDEHNHVNEELPWRAWGSWFSWGSPVGLGLGWALIAVSSGLCAYLLHLAGLIGIK